jgi:hypothetical protein
MITVNTLIKLEQHNGKESVERVLWLDRRQNLAYVININIYSNESPFQGIFLILRKALSRGLQAYWTTTRLLRLLMKGNCLINQEKCGIKHGR